ncbi:MAG TPA: restriction endonuclease [Clostridia bacterium]|nr:restriction endonuclease [Clostridia bacterium]
MAIPSLFDITLPMLKLLADGSTHALKELGDTLANQFGLTEADLSERIPSGMPKFKNRLGWARSELRLAGLVELPKPKHLRITDRGREVLRSNPVRLDRSFFMRYPDYAEAVSGRENRTEQTSVAVAVAPTSVSLDAAPEEVLESSFSNIQHRIESELLDKVKTCSPAFFEKLVIDLLHRMGYGKFRDGAAIVTGKPGDEGIDGVISEDPLGLDLVHVQAKRWENPVGRPDVQLFVGALQGKQARKGVFITTSSYNENARDYVRTVGVKIALIDGQKLAHLMYEHNVGVSDRRTLVLKSVDSDYFLEDQED